MVRFLKSIQNEASSLVPRLNSSKNPNNGVDTFGEMTKTNFMAYNFLSSPGYPFFPTAIENYLVIFVHIGEI